MKTQRELNQHYWNNIHDMVIAYNKYLVGGSDELDKIFAQIAS